MRYACMFVSLPELVSHFFSPRTLPQLKGLGFDGYATDYVSCPDGLYWFLRKELNMHRTVRSIHALPGCD